MRFLLVLPSLITATIVPEGKFLVTEESDSLTVVGVKLKNVSLREAKKAAEDRDFKGFLDPKDESGLMKQNASIDYFAIGGISSATVVNLNGVNNILTCSSDHFGPEYGYYVFSNETPASKKPIGYTQSILGKINNRSRTYDNKEIKVIIGGEEIASPSDPRHRAVVKFCNILAQRFIVLNHIDPYLNQ